MFDESTMGSEESRLAEASAASTTPWKLSELADDPHWVIRLAVAENPGASSTTLLWLSRDGDSTVAQAAQRRLGATQPIA